MRGGAPKGGPEPSNELIETLRDAQRLGFFGPAPIELAAEHARAFVVALDVLAPGSRIVDLGSGGGLPGLVVAIAHPRSSVLLVDRREKRTDFLRRAVLRLELRHVEVRTGDVGELARAVERGDEPGFDAVTARGFGPPASTLRLASRLLAPDGRVVISEPPAGDRWDPALLARIGLRGTRIGSVRRFERSEQPPPRFP